MQEISEIKTYAKMHAVPIMFDGGINFIEEYIQKNNVHKVLEIGTAIGYSAIRFAKAGEEVFVSTIEMDIERYKAAVKNVCDNDLMDRITLYLGDAGTWNTDEKFDLIFIDGPKAQYINHFERFKNNLAPGGVFIADNLSFHGMVEDLSLTHNYSTMKMVKKIQRFIHFLRDNKEFKTVFYDVGDRLSVSKRV